METPNPYAPPSADILASTTAAPWSGARVFSPATIHIHAILQPVLGVVLAALNHHRLGDARGARRALLLYGVPSLLATTLVVLMGERLKILAFPYALIVGAVLGREQKAFLAPHLAAGARKVPWYRVTLTCLAIAFVLAVLAVIGMLLFGSPAES